MTLHPLVQQTARFALPAALAASLVACASAPQQGAQPPQGQAPQRQLLVTANENKVELPGGVATVMPNNPPDSISIFDVNVSPARLLANVNVPVSVIGPPQSVALSPDLSVAIVSATTRFDPADRNKTIEGNTVSVVDLQANPPAVVQSVTTGPAPANAAVSPDGKLVLITTRGDSAVLVFSLQGKRLAQTARIALPEKSVPGGVSISPDGKRALVTRDGDSTVTVLAINGNEVKLAGRDFYTGTRPYGVHISPDGQWAIVGNVGRGNGDVDTMSLVDMRGPVPRAIDHAPVGPTAEGVAMSPNSKLVAAVVHDGTNRPPSFPFYKERGQVVVMRIDGGKLVPLGSSPIGRWSQGVAFSADSKRLFVSNMVEKNIQVFRVEANGIVDTGERMSLPGGGASMVIGAR
jgi:DNA-binding beta-propeller fold protein YncE